MEYLSVRQTGASSLSKRGKVCRLGRLFVFVRISGCVRQQRTIRGSLEHCRLSLRESACSRASPSLGSFQPNLREYLAQPQSLVVADPQQQLATKIPQEGLTSLRRSEDCAIPDRLKLSFCCRTTVLIVFKSNLGSRSPYRKSRDQNSIRGGHGASNEYNHDAGWSSPVAREAHNLEVVSSNLAPAT